MSKFRFRAQAALDLRQREWQAAQGDLARAEQVRDMAARDVEKSVQALAEAQQASAEQAQTARSASELQWYRFWILRLDHERQRARTVLAARQGEVAKFVAACLHAKQRYESLESLRDKMRQAFERAEADAERKAIDEIATLRFNIDRRGSSFNSREGAA
jgi:flagellar export protein FliJ